MPETTLAVREAWNGIKHGTGTMPPMIVSNAKHETAIVIRRDGQVAVLVRLRAGKLGCERETESAFREHWREVPYPLMETLDRFLAHAQTHGCSQEALKALEKLKARERYAVANLF